MVMTTKNCFSLVPTVILRDRTVPLLIEGAPVAVKMPEISISERKDIMTDYDKDNDKNDNNGEKDKNKSMSIRTRKDVMFCNERPMRRWDWFMGDYYVILDPQVMNFERVNLGVSPYLFSHNRESIMGRVDRAWPNGIKGYCDVSFNDSPLADQLYRDIENGFCLGVSPSIADMAFEVVAINDDDIYTFRITQGEFLELSSVSIAANPEAKFDVSGGDPPLDSVAGDVLFFEDAELEGAAQKLPDGTVKVSERVKGSVQVYHERLMKAVDEFKAKKSSEGTDSPSGDQGDPQGVTAQQEPVETEPESAQDQNFGQRGDTQVPDKIETPENEVASESLATQFAELKASHNAGEQDRKNAKGVMDMLQLGMQHNAMDALSAHLKEGGTPEGFSEKLKDVNFIKNVRQSPIKEVNGRGGTRRDFSLHRLLIAKVWPEDVQAQRDAEYELTAGQKLSQMANMGGSMVPFDAYAGGGYKLGRGMPPKMYHIGDREEEFAVSTGTASGGSTVETLWDFDRTVDFLVEDSDILQFCDVAMGLTGNVQVPIETTGATLGYNAEGVVQAESSPTFTHYTATPVTLSAQVKITKRLLQQTGGWVERKIRMLLARQFRSQINSGILKGTGSANNQPGGISVATGIPNLGVSGGGTLATISWDDIVDMEEKVDNEWVPEYGRAWVIGQSTYGTLMKAPKAGSTSTFPIYILDGEMGDRHTRMLMNYPAVKSSFLAETGTVAALADTKGHIIFGNWLDMFVGFWEAFEVVVEGITSPLQITTTVAVDWDAVVARKASFVQGAFS